MLQPWPLLLTPATAAGDPLALPLPAVVDDQNCDAVVSRESRVVVVDYS